MKRNAGFGLVGAFFVVVLGVILVCTVVYVCKMMIDRAKTIESRRRQQLTNELVEPFPTNFPEAPAWLVEEDLGEWMALEDGTWVWDVPLEDLEPILASVAEFNLESAPTVQGPWTGGDTLTGTETAVKETLVEILRAYAATQPFPSCGFIRYSRP